ncbi:unnamed protein product [Rhizoctonia solani]|uniref:Mid2 domain-containing protein n=1 Tax=Rhizoctonia solani TaxID=456999 RepID=A0A8H3DD37_9AGAM|nr:unnamed protein product [Rhizoctonia solani]
MTPFALLVVALGICHRVAAWGILTPVHVLGGLYYSHRDNLLMGSGEERQRVQVELTNDDGGGYNWPYEFEVWKNVSGKDDERIHLQDVRATPIFWDNNQPVGTFIRFHIKDTNNFVSGSNFIQVEPDPAISMSSVSTMSTASVASVMSTATITTLVTSSRPTTARNPATEMASATASPGPTSLTTNTGAVAGGVVGGVLVLAAITAALVLFLRRRASKPRKEKIDILSQPTAATPFIYEDPYRARTDQQRYDDPSQPYQGAGDAPPIYSPAPTSPNPLSPGGPSSHASVAPGVSTKKGAYAPVSTIPH